MNFVKHSLAAAVAGGLLLAGAGTTLAQPAGDDPNTVQMQGNLFAKTQVVVPAGTTLTWVNLDSETHDVLSTDSDLLSSPPVDPGQSWSFVFTTPGTYSYLCDLHANMEGVVTVVDGTAVAEGDPAAA